MQFIYNLARPCKGCNLVYIKICNEGFDLLPLEQPLSDPLTSK